jgi:Ca-activated chloride channel family protein
MEALTPLLHAVRSLRVEWLAADASRFEFGAVRGALLAAAGFALFAVLVMLVRAARGGDAVRGRLALPAILPGLRRSPLAATRHVPLVLALAGLPFLIVALADPFISFAHRQATYPGRRIAVMVDASTSMNQPFATATLGQRGEATYFATVAAAEYFMRLRMQGPHRDLISLIEFGSEAYVVTPFTTDYENILLSLRLIAQPGEWERFPDQGTIIIQAVRQAIALFRSFDFLEASGNLIVIFSDGQDTQTKVDGHSIEEIMAEARRHRIPVYFIRMAYNKALGTVLPDELWQKAVARTGGRFYSGADERTLLRAVHEIDQLAPGRIELRQYQAQRPYFAGYAFAALGLWTLAALLRLGMNRFRTFP